MPIDTSGMQDTFICLTDGCGKEVIYRRKIVLGLTTFRGDVDLRPNPKRVYLRCAAGHNHPYEVFE